MCLDPSVAYFGIIFSLASRVLSTTFRTKLDYVGVGEGGGVVLPIMAYMGKPRPSSVLKG